MIKKLFASLLILALATTFSGCEKDDICAESTETTPRLVIEFYNKSIPSDKKNVTDLSVVNTAEQSPITVNGASKIIIPLKTTEDSVEYTFTIFSKNPDPAIQNTDKLTFNYDRNSIFISRACGFRIAFLLKKANGVVLTDADSSLWIKSIQVVNSTIATEKETHVKIFF